MKVLLLRDIKNTSPSVILRAGSTIEVSDTHGYELILEGIAQHVDAPVVAPEKKEKPSTIQTATKSPETFKRKI